MEYLINSKSLRIQMGKVAGNNARQKFQLRSNVTNLLHHYASTCNRPYSNKLGDHKIKLIWLALYYGLAIHLPGSYSFMGKLFRAKAIRYALCRRIFLKCGKNVNIEHGCNFGSGLSGYILVYPLFSSRDQSGRITTYNGIGCKIFTYYSTCRYYSSVFYDPARSK